MNYKLIPENLIPGDLYIVIENGTFGQEGINQKKDSILTFLEIIKVSLSNEYTIYTFLTSDNKIISTFGALLRSIIVLNHELNGLEG